MWSTTLFENCLLNSQSRSTWAGPLNFPHVSKAFSFWIQFLATRWPRRWVFHRLAKVLLEINLNHENDFFLLGYTFNYMNHQCCILNAGKFMGKKTNLDSFVWSFFLVLSGLTFFDTTYRVYMYDCRWLTAVFKF